mmetsp:Transcript_46358/g.83659  ORF Transcript_46358/g.83659 Transcript_46358/m.83659 type:complete len:847 (+) Transcript_46358:75-2615(+)
MAAVGPPLVQRQQTEASIKPTEESLNQEHVNEDHRKPNGLKKTVKRVRWLGWISAPQKALEVGKTFVSQLSISTSGEAKERYTPDTLEQSLYSGTCHDSTDPDVLNIRELFGEIDDKELERAKHIWRFHLSDAAATVAWVMVASILVTAVVSPLSWILGGTWNNADLVPGGRSLLIVDMLLDAIYGVCLVLQFKISFLHPLLRTEVIDPAAIRKFHTSKFGFWLCAMSCFMFIPVLAGADLMVQLFKVVRLGPLLHLPDSMWKYDDTALVRLGRPVLCLLLSSHWVACMLFSIGGFRALALANEGAYATTIGIGYWSTEVPGTFSLYMMSLVEAVYMLTGALDNPLGDGSPREKNFGALVIVFVFGPIGCVFVSWFIASVVREHARAYALDVRHDENRAFMERALEILNIPEPLAHRVLSIHTFKRKGHDDEAFRSLFENNTMSKSLESALLVYLHRDTVLSSKYFSGKDPNYVIAVINVLEDQVFLPGDYVARRGEVASEMYFVGRGTLSILIPDPVEGSNVDLAKAVGILKKGSFFGEIALVKETTRTAWARADQFVVVSALSRNKIDGIWSFYPKEREELVSSVEATAKRDKHRRLRENWTRGIEASRNWDKQDTFFVSKLDSRTSKSSNAKEAKRKSSRYDKPKEDEGERQNGHNGSEANRTVVSWDIASAPPDDDSDCSVRGDERRENNAATATLSLAAFSADSESRPHIISRALHGSESVMEKLEVIESRFDEMFQRQASLEQAVSSALTVLRATSGAQATSESTSLSPPWQGSEPQNGKASTVEEKQRLSMQRPVSAVAAEAQDLPELQKTRKKSIKVKSKQSKLATDTKPSASASATS